MFRSARVKLTLFYLAILLGFSLVFTMTIRVLAEKEYSHSNDIQRGEVRHLFIGFNDNGPPQGFPGQPYKAFNDVQSDQEATVRAHLNRDMALINTAALVVGGLVAYWFAGRTLKPIEEAHNAQKRFAADASHELRTPLASMKLENEVFLRQSTFTKEEARDQIKSNLEEVQRLESLSNNLLALTNYGKGALELHAVGVESVVAEALQHAQTVADVKHVTFDAKVSGAAHAHYESLVQLVGILLDNAIKYGPEKGTIKVRGSSHAGQYILQVIDEGPGISDTDLPHIFERLYRGDKSRTGKNGGYGLGLALAQQIAEANHAAISARNRASKGACFEVRLEAVKR
jgi:signal transduction histidine kinase